MKSPQTELMESTNIWRRLPSCFHSELNYIPSVNGDRQRVMSEITIGDHFSVLRKPRAGIAGQSKQTQSAVCLEYLLRVRRERKRERQRYKPEILQAGDLLVLTTPYFPASLKSVGSKFPFSAGVLRKDARLANSIGIVLLWFWRGNTAHGRQAEHL